MTGDERQRHCARCDRMVHNLSVLSPEQAERLATTGICGEYVADAAGAPIHTDRTILAPTRPAILAALLMAACAPHFADDDVEPVEDAAPAATPGTVIPNVEVPTLPAPTPVDAESHEADHDPHEGECDHDHAEAIRGLVVTLNDIVIAEVIYFPSGGVGVPDRAKPILDEIASLMQSIPEIRKVAIVGHSDDTGTEAQQNDAAHDRAEAVRRYLEDQGVESERFTIESRGAREPVTSNATQEGRTRNRRVSFEIVERANP